MSDIKGYILAGGASSRMGTDKAALRLGNLSFVERAERALRPVAEEVFIVSSKPGASRWGLPVIRDRHEQSGALGGLHAALSHAQSGWVAVVSCDLPFVTGGLFGRLASLLATDSDAVAPVQPDGRPQPLCAFYRVESCLGLADEMIRTGKLRPGELLTRVRTRWIAFKELSDLKDAPLFFLNVNTPAEYETAREAARRGEKK